MPRLRRRSLSNLRSRRSPKASADAGEVGSSVPELLPVIPLRQAVLFPFTMTSLILDSEAEKKLVEDIVPKHRLVAMVPLVARDKEAPGADALFPVGCVGRIVKVLKFPDDTVRVLVRGVRRVRLLAVRSTTPYTTALFADAADTLSKDVEVEVMTRNATAQFQEVISISPTLPDELKVALLNIDEPGRLADLIANSLNLSQAERLELLGATDVRKRLEVLTVYLNREAQMLKLGSEIQSRVNSTFSKQQRDTWLREQARAIQEQLGEEPDSPDIAELKKKLEAAALPAEAKETAQRELERLRKMHPAAGDYNVARTYLEWLLALPWDKNSTDTLDIRRAHEILDADHYDLIKVKERILEYLAVLQLKKDMKAPILCFVGPPGVGKTSLGHSIARALGREFVRISLGGIRDEAEIRGHRRTYVGALPGRIIQGIRKAKTANPVFMLDEIDKIGTDFRGDPGAALLEVLDPQQNATFSDHYLEVTFDLSRVMFITTANLTDTIPPALFDRMEVLRLPGYTHNEKCQIARRFLIPRQIEANGLKTEQLTLSDDALGSLIACYTCEAGVRNLEREIASICRKYGRRLVEGTAKPDATLVVKPATVTEFLGPQKLFPDKAPVAPQVGVATGLAWTAAGGEILQIEVTSFPGKGQLLLTGSLGDVMKESAQAAFSFVRSHHTELDIDPAQIGKLDFHVHVPAGATPKDGPSAGVTIATALASLLSGRPVTPQLAMTGEISLRGRVLPVGGIKEKVLAAVRADVKTIILPANNRNDLEEIPEELRKAVTFVFVEEALPALNAALAGPPKNRKKTNRRGK